MPCGTPSHSQIPEQLEAIGERLQALTFLRVNDFSAIKNERKWSNSMSKQKLTVLVFFDDMICGVAQLHGLLYSTLLKLEIHSPSSENHEIVVNDTTINIDPWHAMMQCGCARSCGNWAAKLWYRFYDMLPENRWLGGKELSLVWHHNDQLEYTAQAIQLTLFTPIAVQLNHQLK